VAVRVLTGPDSDDLAELYARPADHDGAWLRVNFVSTVDGAAQGEDGRSGGINNAADKLVFDALRAMADVLVVGAGTLRTEGYGATALPLVVVTRSGHVPDKLRDADRGKVLMATTATAPGLAEARRLLGDDHVLVLGHDEVDLAALKAELAGRGWTEQLSEGGPSLFRAMLAAGVVDELCLTTVPRLIAGDHLRVAAGLPVDAPLELALLLEEEGTLLARWLVGPARSTES
jgi:riboflavin biosynthesis pyrimidine reductase